MRLPFIGPTYRHKSPHISSQRCVNMFPEKMEAPPGKEGEIASLLDCPGLLALVSAAAVGGYGDEVRGFHLLKDGTFIAIVGPNVLQVTAAGPPATIVARGTLLTTNGYVGIDDNGTTIMIVDGPYGYVLPVAGATAAAQITDPDFLGATRVWFVDGYFVLNEPNSGRFYYTDLYSTDINALDFQTAESSPDNIVAHATLNGELWFLGDLTTEVFYNSGGQGGNAFARNKGAVIEYGCQAPNSVVKIDTSLIWIGKDRNGGGMVVQASGYQPKRVSTHAIEQALQQAGNLAQATAWGYQQEGHTFYMLNVPGLATTFCYDLATGMWHERQYFNTATGVYERHPAQHHVYAFGLNIVGRYNSPMLYQYSFAKFTDDGNPRVRIRSSPIVSKELARIFYSSLELDVETGVGLDGAPVVGADPKVELRWSEDSGRTWSAPVSETLGKLGETLARARWNRLGSGRNRVFEIRCSDPVRFNLTGVTLDAVGGEH